MRILSLLFVAFLVTACRSESSIEQKLGPGCTVGQPDPHACDPANTKKTTICHIPPGNPANAHTICVGNAAVPAHVNNHGDFIGTCSCPLDAGMDDDDDDCSDGGVGGDGDAGVDPDAGPGDPIPEDGGLIVP
jgi:hypothetical protein